MTALSLRPAVPADAEALADIYNVEVETSTVTFDLRPRTVAEQRHWIANRSGAHVALVAVNGVDVVGFGSLSPYKERAGYSSTVEDSVYVHRDRQGGGVGKLILGGLVERATAHGFHSVIARVVGGHEASIGLHAALGFSQVGHEREVGRKFGRWLDVIVMQRLLS